MKQRYSDQELIVAIQKSLSFAQTLRFLGVVPAGGNYAILKRKIKRLGIDTSHFTGQAWNRGLKVACRSPMLLSKILVENHPYSSSQLRQRLIKEGYRSHQCENCCLAEWLGQAIPLELDHINGYHDDNRLENLRLLCPNCHTLTPTYRGKNKKSSKYQRARSPKGYISNTPQVLSRIEDFLCLDCSKKISRRGTRCKSCTAKMQESKIQWPSIDELQERLAKSNYSKLGRELGVSGNAVRKHLKVR